MAGQNYAEAEAKAARFAGRLSDALGDRMVGLYLVGSFALADLQPDSDLDFVAVLSDCCPPRWMKTAATPILETAVGRG